MFKLKFLSKGEENKISPPVIESVKELKVNSEIVSKDFQTALEELLANNNITKEKVSDIDKLHEELRIFKENNFKLRSKIEKLEKLGFTNTPSAKVKLKEYNNKISKYENRINYIKLQIQKVEELEDLINKYALEYPGKKFIPTEVMYNILEKYELVLGPNMLYSKEIPEDALDEISKFSHKIVGKYQLSINSKANFPSDILKRVEPTTIEQVRYYANRLFEALQSESKIALPTTLDELIEDPYKYYTASCSDEVHTLAKVKSTLNLKCNVTNLVMIAPNSHFDIPTIEYRGESFPSFVLDNYRCLKENTAELKKIQEKFREIDDPIAALEVKGGFIILKAWDKEADIPEIQNEVNN